LDPQDLAIHTLRHHQATALAPLVQRFLQRDEIAEADPATNSVVVGAGAASRARVKVLIERLEAAFENKLDVVPIRPGMRTYSLPLPAEDATANHFAAGDHVDVLVTLTGRADEAGRPGSTSAETPVRTMLLIADVEVRAVDHAPYAAAAEPRSVATLDLHPVECLTLQYAQHVGRVKLAKRNAEDRVVKADPELGALACQGANLGAIVKAAGEKRAHDTRAEVALDP